MLEPIVRPATANTAVDPDTQRLVAYDRKRDRFVQPGGWFSRPERFLVTNQRDPEACIESVVDWHVPGIDGGAGAEARSAFRVACAPGSEEAFVRAWALEPHADADARMRDLFLRAAQAVGTEGSGARWAERLAEAVTELAFDEAGTYWDVVTFRPADGDGATREVEVDLRYVADPVDGAMAGLLRYTQTTFREQLRGALLAALEAHIGLEEPLSRLSSSGRAVGRAVAEAATELGMSVEQFRLSPVQLDPAVAGLRRRQPARPVPQCLGPASPARARHTGQAPPP